MINRFKLLIAGLMVLTLFAVDQVPADDPPPPPHITDTVFSWGNYYDTLYEDYVCYVTPVRQDQGDCAASAAFAICAALESRVEFARRLPDLDLDLSEQFVISCVGNGESCISPPLDSILEYADNDVSDEGIPIEECFDWISDTTSAGDTPAACSLGCAFPGNGAFQLTSHHTMQSADTCLPRDTIKTYLLDGGPLLAKIVVPDSVFRQFDTSHVNEDGVWENRAITDTTYWVLYYGWDDTLDCWLAKGSFGADWGQAGPTLLGADSGGFFKFAMGQSGCDEEICWVGYDEPDYFSWGEYVKANGDTACYMSPLRQQQGSCTACETFAAMSLIEAVAEWKLDRPNLNVDLSEQYSYSCWDGPLCGAVLGHAASSGIPLESCFGWADEEACNPKPACECDPDVGICERMFADAWFVDGSREYGDYTNRISNDSVKTLVLDQGPLVYHMWFIYGVTDSFFTFSETYRDKSGVWVGEYYDTAKTTDWQSHKVMVYGWDDADSCWLVKNSLLSDLDSVVGVTIYGDTIYGGWGECGPAYATDSADSAGHFRLRMISSSYGYTSATWNPIDAPTLIDPWDTASLSPDICLTFRWSGDYQSESRIQIYDGCEIVFDSAVTGQLMRIPPLEDGTYDWCVRYQYPGDSSSRFSHTRSFSISYDDCCYMRGDVHKDSTLDINDVIDLAGYVNNQTPVPSCLAEADVNGDCTINSADVQALTDSLYYSCDTCIAPCP